MNDREVRAADYSRRVKEKRRLRMVARMWAVIALVALLAWALSKQIT